MGRSHQLPRALMNSPGSNRPPSNPYKKHPFTHDNQQTLEGKRTRVTHLSELDGFSIHKHFLLSRFRWFHQ